MHNAEPKQSDVTEYVFDARRRAQAKESTNIVGYNKAPNRVS